jgi:ATP-dependent DNA helicase RecG
MIETWGRGTIKIAELMAGAGRPPPEFETRAGEVVVRFRPPRYVPPARTDQTLSPLQREFLAVLASSGPLRLGQLMQALGPRVAESTLQDSLQLLRRLGLVTLQGQRRSSRWTLVRASTRTGDLDE